MLLAIISQILGIDNNCFFELLKISSTELLYANNVRLNLGPIPLILVNAIFSRMFITGSLNIRNTLFLFQTFAPISFYECYLCILKLRTMEMKEPFDIEIGEIVYSVFPDEEDTYTIFKEGKEYVQIIKDTGTNWLKLHPETGLRLFDMDEEVNHIGAEITKDLES